MAIAVDATHLYWTEQNEDGLRIVKAPKKGGGPVSDLGWYYGGDVSGRLIVVDATHVFWVRNRQLARVRKDGGEATEILLDQADAEWVGSALDDGDVVWVAHFGCSKLARVPKVGGSPTLFPLHADQPFRYGGVTDLVNDGDQIYCSNGPNLYAFQKNTGAVEKVVSSQRRISGLAKVGGDIYWINNNGGYEEQRLVVLREGRAASEDLGFSLGPVGILHHDPTRQRLYWIAGSRYETPVAAYDLRSREISILADKQPVSGGDAQDEKYIYWAAEHEIMRLAK